jgi:PAS fold
MTLDRGTRKDASRAAPVAGVTIRGTGRPGAGLPGVGLPGVGRAPLAVVVVDHDGLVERWSSGACRLFGVADEHAVGRPALDLLPVFGALPSEGERGTTAPRRASGRARLSAPDGGRVDVLWWAYPLSGPHRDGLLVLATDATGLRPRGTQRRLALDPMAACGRGGLAVASAPGR